MKIRKLLLMGVVASALAIPTYTVFAAEAQNAGITDGISNTVSVAEMQQNCIDMMNMSGVDASAMMNMSGADMAAMMNMTGMGLPG